MQRTIGNGQGGKSFQDRELAAEVRKLTLEKSKKILKGEKPKNLYEALLIKLAGTALPRLNEHTGAEGGPIEIAGVDVTLRE